MKNTDCWEEGDMVFVHFGKRYGLTPDCRTVCLGLVVEESATPVTEPSKLLRVIRHPSTPVTPDLDANIRLLAGQGMGIRAISRELKLPNHMIVWRTLQKPLIAVKQNAWR